MAGKLIALESTNQQLLDKTAKYLALKLQSEGKTVEILSFPQAKQSSGHFVQSHQKGEYGEVNPYAASMFYILDRYDASPQIRQYLKQETIVICKSYRGTSLAKLGASISDAPTRKGFYLWADSLESGTFGVPRPDMAIVLSEELPTLYELCELFPKDYVFALNPTKIRNLLNKLIPPAVAVVRKTGAHRVSLYAALKASGAGPTFEFEATEGYVNLSKNSDAHKQYANGLHELEELKKLALSKLSDEDKDQAAQFLAPLGTVGLVACELTTTTGYKNRVLQKLIAQNFESNYGMPLKSVTLITKTYSNELAFLPELLLTKTELSFQELAVIVERMPVRQKIELYKSYLAGVDNDPNEYPFKQVTISVAAQISYYDLLQLKKRIPSIRFSMQSPTPRWGFDTPETFDTVSDEIENCFLASLKVYSHLVEIDEQKGAESVVLAGSITQACILFDGLAARRLCFGANGFVTKSKALQDIVSLLLEELPITTSR